MTVKDFVSNWCKRIRSDGIKIFPDDFIPDYLFKNKDVDEIILPPKQLIVGNEFFGHYEILTSDGASVMQVDTHDKAKYLVYSSRHKPEKILIPQKTAEIKEVITSYHKYLDNIISQIKLDFNKNFQSSKDFNQTVNEIFRILNIIKY